MTEIHICNICGKEMEGPPPLEIEIPQVRDFLGLLNIPEEPTLYYQEKDVELCYNCSLEVVKFMDKIRDNKGTKMDTDGNYTYTTTWG